MRDLVIVGAGGHGRETLDIVEAINAVDPTWNVLGLADDAELSDEANRRLERRGVRLMGDTEAAIGSSARYVLAIGSSQIRAKLDKAFTDGDCPAATLIHPLASVASDNRVGAGVLLAAGARVTTNVTLGRHVHLNVNAVVSHDCTVGDYSTLSPGVFLNGEVTVGKRVFLGTGAIVTPGVTVGDDAVVGAGAVVIRDVLPGERVVGVPAE